jgi:phage-related protein
MAGSDTLSAGAVSLTVKPNADGFGKSLSDAVKGQATGIGGEIGGVLMDGLKAVAAPLAALAVGLSLKHVIDESVKAFEDLGTSVRGMQRIAGGSMEQVSGLRGAMQLAGVNADDTTAAFTRFQKQLGNTIGDAGATAEMTKKLGVSFTDATGAIKPMSEILPGLADKFKDMPNGAEKTALATDLFGRSGAQLIPILNKGSDGMAELTAKAKDLGLVLDDTSMKSLAESKQSARDFAAAIQGLKVTLGGDLLPVLDAVQNIFRNAFSPVIVSVTHFLQENRGEFMKLADSISEFGKKVSPIITEVFGFIGGIITSVFKSVAGAGGTMMSGLAPTFTAIGGLFQSLGPVFASLLPQVMQLFSAFSPIGLIFKSLEPVLPALIGMLGQLAATLAGALGVALQAILPAISNLVSMLVTTLSGILIQLMPTFTDLVQMLGPILAGVIMQLVPVILDLVKVIGPILQTVMAALAPYWADLAGLVMEVVKAIMPLIPTVLGLVMAFVPLLEPIIELVAKLLPPLIDLFKTLVVPLLHLAVTVFQGVFIPVLQIVIGIITWMISWLLPPLIRAFEGVGNVVTAIFTGIAGFLKGIANIAISIINGIFDAVNPILDGPVGDVMRGVGINVTHLNHIPALAEGGIVPATNGGRLVRVAEAGEAEAVVPLSKLGNLGGNGANQTVNYYAAPNQSIDSQQALFDGMRRAKLLAGW